MILWSALAILALVIWVGSEVLRNLLVRLVWALRMPFRKGDFVSIGGVGGKVERVGWQAVQLRNSSGDLVFVANCHIWEKPVVQTVAESGSQGIELHLPVYIDCEQIRARLAAREAVILSPYLALDRPIDVALELSERGEAQVRVQAGVFDASQRALFESSVIESYRAILTDQ